MTPAGWVGLAILALVAVSLLFVGWWLLRWAFSDDDRGYDPSGFVKAIMDKMRERP